MFCIFPVFIFLLALVIAVLVSVLPQEHLAGLFYVSRFIEVMIPILGAGALIKYLFSKPGTCSRCKSNACKDKTPDHAE